MKMYETVKMMGNTELLTKCKEFVKSNWPEMQKKISNEGMRSEVVDYMIGKNECKHEQVLLFKTYLGLENRVGI